MAEPDSQSAAFLDQTAFLDQNLQSQMRGLTIVFIVLAAFFVVLRVFARQRTPIGIGIDDHLIFVSLFVLFAMGVLNIMMIQYGAGKHISIVPASDVVRMLKVLLVFEIAYVFSVTLTKCSILLMYCRIFPVKSVRRFALLLGVLSIAWAITIIIISFLQCTPLEKAWHPLLPGHCIDMRTSFISTAIPNILTDVAILTLPMPHVWKLRVSVGQRVAISVIFLLGAFVVFTSIYRFTTLLSFGPFDVTRTSAIPSTWSVVEPAAGIVSACLPTLRPLLRIISARLGLHSGSSKAARNEDGVVTIGGSGEGAGKSLGSRQQDLDFSDDNVYHTVDLGNPQDSQISGSACHQIPASRSNRSEVSSGDGIPSDMNKTGSSIVQTEWKRW